MEDYEVCYNWKPALFNKKCSDSGREDESIQWPI